jgi:hypothetical protein
MTIKWPADSYAEQQILVFPPASPGKPLHHDDRHAREMPHATATNACLGTSRASKRMQLVFGHRI